MADDLVAIGACFGPHFDPVTIQRIVVDHALVVIPKDELRKLRYLHVGQNMKTVNINSHRSTQSQCNDSNLLCMSSK